MPNPRPSVPHEAQESAAIEVERLTVQYGARSEPALNETTFQVESDEFVCLLGPSGCGKSTLLKAIAGFLPATPDGLKKIITDGRLNLAFDQELTEQLANEADFLKKQDIVPDSFDSSTLLAPDLLREVVPDKVEVD